MWPLCFLLNKILNVEDGERGVEKVHGVDEYCVNAGECCPLGPSSCSVECQDAVLPCSYFIEAPHINQLHSWDCGLACVLMALNTIGINDVSIQTLADLCRTTSIWTVDLAFLLQKFSVTFSYFTVTLGANPNYSAETFYKLQMKVALCNSYEFLVAFKSCFMLYAQEQLPADLVRVDMLFQKSVDAGICIQCRSINEKEISLLILSGKFIAIALVNLYKLSQSWLEDIIQANLSSNNLGYAGHYVVICGYDAGADEFEIRDPASSRKNERISSKHLQEARKSFGTDEDLLLISLEKIDNQNSSSVQLSSPVNKSP